LYEQILFFGGAFENFNFIDILVFGGIAFLLYKLFAARAGAAQRPSYNRTANNTDMDINIHKTQ
jgi:hypothetical protein